MLFPVGNNAKVLLTVRHAFYQKSFAAAVPLHPFNAASVIWGGKEAANAAHQDSRAVTRHANLNPVLCSERDKMIGYRREMTDRNHSE